MRKKPVLIIQHSALEHPAALRRALHTQGIPSLWIHPYRGEIFPEIEQIAGVIAMGGPMSANDEAIHSWLDQEQRFLRDCVYENLPVAGICLGGQLLAKALGGKVEKNPQAEVGWHTIQLTEAGHQDRILGNVASLSTGPVVYQWHEDTFFVPEGATLLATSPACGRQAFRIGDQVYGFQFHPEADHQLVHEWLSAEGVEAEIQSMADSHGLTTVQTAETQRALALAGERANLRITAGIGQLFQLENYQPIAETQRRTWNEFALHRWEVGLTITTADGRDVLLRGTMIAIFNTADAEFLILRDEDSLLWPIRLDHAKNLKPFSK